MFKKGCGVYLLGMAAWAAYRGVNSFSHPVAGWEYLGWDSPAELAWAWLALASIFAALGAIVDLDVATRRADSGE